VNNSNKTIISQGILITKTQADIGNWVFDWALNVSAPSSEEFSAVSVLIEKLRYDFDIAD